jgi:hypothetical protein
MAHNTSLAANSLPIEPTPCPADAPPTPIIPSAAAIRMRDHRERRRLGLRCVTVQLRATEIEVLIQKNCSNLMRVTTPMLSAMPFTAISTAR